MQHFIAIFPIAVEKVWTQVVNRATPPAWLKIINYCILLTNSTCSSWDYLYERVRGGCSHVWLVHISSKTLHLLFPQYTALLVRPQWSALCFYFVQFQKFQPHIWHHQVDLQVRGGRKEKTADKKQLNTIFTTLTVVFTIRNSDATFSNLESKYKVSGHLLQKDCWCSCLCTAAADLIT